MKSEILVFFFHIPSIFWEKFTKTIIKQGKKLNQVRINSKFSLISMIIFTLFYILTLSNSKKNDDPEQHNFVMITTANNHMALPLLYCNDDIWSVGLGCESESIDQGRSYLDMNIYISNCFFSRYLTYSGNGGVIHVYGGDYSMNINYSMLYNCVSSNYGGAIYFSSSNSLVRMICANSCSASQFHFAYLWDSQVNQVDYLSVSNCTHFASGVNTICLSTGNQSVDKTNSSMNTAKQVSGIIIWSPSSFTSSFCTFSNNKASEGICLYIYSTPGTILMTYFNIVHNNSPVYGVVLVNGEGSRKMIYCIFHNNSNYLFCVYGVPLEVSHSFMDHLESSFFNNIAVSTEINNSNIN